MSLIRRKRRDRAIRISEAAVIIGCSSESIRTGAVGGFRIFKLNPDRVTSPFLIRESELDAYLEHRDKELGVNA